MIYRIDELPATLDSREKEVTRILADKTLKQRNTIRDLRKALKERVEDLASKEREEVYHPKLESIAKNTLPLFERVMLSSLTKDLPEDPDEFYHAATESLKGCVKGLSGQGRYLSGVFPEEMKEIRGMVDRIGREMNDLTPSIAEARSKRTLLSAVRADLSRFSWSETEKKRGIVEIAQLKEEIDREEQEIGRIRERIEIMKDKVETEPFSGLREEVAGLNRDFLREERALQADLAVISHVLRKGEKVLVRSMGHASVKELEALVDTLAANDIPVENQIMPGLIRSLPLVRSMVASGDLTLKNKEEKELFSKDTDLVARVKDGFNRREIAYRRFQAKERVYRESPLLTELSAAQEEEERMAVHIELMKSRLAGATEKDAALEDEIPELASRIRNGLESLLGHRVSLVKPEES